MTELLHLTTNYSFAYLNNHGKEVHGTGRFNSKLEALEQLCSNSNTIITDDLKERFGVGKSAEAVCEAVTLLQSEVEKLKAMQITTYDLIQNKQVTTPEKTPAKQNAKGPKTPVKQKSNAK